VEDDVFQLDELVNPYRVALSNYLEENSKFCIAENTFINVDIEELKDVLRTNKYTQVDEEDDRNEINV
jgi:regulator of replication initiation timing